MQNFGKGHKGFETYFGQVYGKRWPDLYHALQQDNPKITLDNVFSKDLNTYSLDPASIEPVRALQLEPEDQILDMCAAPGGKALVSMFFLEGKGNWVLNDLSSARAKRLQRVLHEHVPKKMIEERVRVTRRDASRWGIHEPNQYDKILIDAPCSGERHLLSSAKHLKQWSVKRSKGLARRQYALLCSALLSLKPGGLLVYSTCSISSMENDEVIRRLQNKKGDQFKLEGNPTCDRAEATELGWQILPDRCLGEGPMYWSVIRKCQ